MRLALLLAVLLFADRSKVRPGTVGCMALGGVLGPGTVICAFLVGPAAQLFLPVSGRICDFFLRKMGAPAPGEEIKP